MYEKMMEKVMSENVTLKDWTEFRTYMENLPQIFDSNRLLAGERPSDEEKRAMAKRRSDLVKAAHYVVSKLSEEDIAQDVVLLLAYEEIHNPEMFS